MNKKRQLVLVCVLLIVFLSVTVLCASGYDSSNDPLVSLSYITEVFKPEIKNEFSEEINILKDQVSELSKEVDSLNKENNELKNDINALSETVDELKNSIDENSYKIIKLKIGDILYVTTSSDLVLRTGSAVVVSPFEDQGLNDYSVGTELLDGDRIFINHYILIPRGNDGRGIRITSQEAYVMVRGGVNIIEAE